MVNFILFFYCKKNGEDLVKQSISFYYGKVCFLLGEKINGQVLFSLTGSFGYCSELFCNKLDSTTKRFSICCHFSSTEHSIHSYLGMHPLSLFTSCWKVRNLGPMDIITMFILN